MDFFSIVYLEANLKDCNKIFKIFWDKKFFNVNVLSDSIDSETNLVTFMPFSDEKCENPTTKVINHFDLTAKKWVNMNYFPNKFKDLHRCKIVHETTLPSVIKSPNGEFRGKEIDIINLFGKILNFSAEHRVLKSFGNISKNGSGSGVLKNLFERKVQLTSGSLQLDRTVLFSESSPFFSDPLLLVIPPASSFSSFEKLYKTFDGEVWAGIVLVFAVAVVFNKAISRKFKLFKNFKESFFVTMVYVFLGGSLQKSQIPNRSFTQIILTSFMLYSLVIRTAYVGILFKFLRNDLKQNDFDNVDQLIDEGFTFYAFESMYDRIVDFKFFNRQVY